MSGGMGGRLESLRARLLALQALGGKCVRCGYGDWRALQIDHVGGDGGRDRRRAGRGYYLAVLQDPHWERYQVLCANCNWVKRFVNHECDGDPADVAGWWDVTMSATVQTTLKRLDRKLLKLQKERAPDGRSTGHGMRWPQYDENGRRVRRSATDECCNVQRVRADP